MQPQDILAEVIGILLGGLSEVATTMGTALSDFVKAIAFFVIVLVFWAITLALSLFRYILNVITSAGNRAR